MAKLSKPKIITDPLLGLIDITEILPLIDTAPFQSLGFKYQLGLTSAIFPAATHTRKQHSLGAYERTRRLADAWLKYGFINEKQAKNLPIFALYHDIGHGPLSHVTESLGSTNHEKRGLVILKTLKNEIESAGFDYEMIYDLFSEKDPLHLAVFDKNLGMEKLDYLERDAFYTIGERPGVEYLAHHVYFIDGKILVNEVAVDQAKDIQNFYIKMYKHVYTRKKTAILQRLIEKMAYYLMKDGLSEDEIFSLTDFGLLGKLETSANEKIRFYYKQFSEGVFPKLTLDFRHEDSLAGPGYGKKLIKTIGLTNDEFEGIMLKPGFERAELLEKIENGLTDLVGAPAGRIVVVPVERRRFEPKDIDVYSPRGVRKMSEIYPDHFKAMREYGRSHLNMRIAAFGEHRKALYDNADKVKRYLLDALRR